MRSIAALLALLVVLPLSGCLGGEERTEWAYSMTQLADAAKAGRTGQGVVVAILDTGINVRHPSLDHLVDGDDENGELIAFKDFLGGAAGVGAAFDDDGHGSHVAGIIAARGSSFGDKLVYGGVDLKGGAPNVRLVVARVCGGDACDANAIPAAVRWAVGQGADVISLSLGGEAGLPLFGLFQDDLTLSINQAINQGVVVIASAGNGGPGAPPDQQTDDVGSPANISGVIAVGAVEKDGQVADISSRGDDAGNPCRGTLPPPIGSIGRCDPNRKPELVAPGVGILSAWKGDAYVRATGTSQATPFVTAVVALMLEGKADLASRSDVEHVKQVLVNTALPVDGQATPHDEAAGYGIVQAEAALQAYR